ncbi:extracellular matrix/biofilm biosynthesis regulator RemA family protein [Clostridium cibarium]|uniref:DUF370 domain-containing protein n=1 Tax=Clostridium cibarium TaxID=2762247 RepID=A0ABR8PTM6_9CLOT|nr:extracellular matrix/biofilm biosynthesis regulator RemA family protein [Clostridium cibarium]MBD7911469.1 DUF370 domain-containing protein [Clostridium cibarium]
MRIKLIKIGFGNFIASNKIIDVISPESVPAKRLIRDARYFGKLINANYGRKTKSIILTDDDYVILCSINFKNFKR